jgi:hypothetical protein
MGFCLGRLGWTPDAFWAATTHELAAAREARVPSGGRGRRPDTRRLARLLGEHPRQAASIRHGRAAHVHDKGR